MIRPTALLSLLLFCAPLLGEPKPIAPSAIGPAVDFISSGHDSAANGDRFLTVWIQRAGDARRVYAVLQNPDGAVLHLEPLRLGLPVENSGAIWNVLPFGDGFAIFWSGNDRRLNLTIIDRDGRILRSVLTQLPSRIRYEASWNGKVFGVAAIDSQAYVTPPGEFYVLDEDGRLLHTPTILTAASFVSRVVPAPDGFFVIHDGRRTRTHYVSRVTNDGHLAAQTSIGVDLAAIGVIREDGFLQHISAPALGPAESIQMTVVAPDGKQGDVTTIPAGSDSLVGSTRVNDLTRVVLWRKVSEGNGIVVILDVTDAGEVRNRTELPVPWNYATATFMGGNLLLTGRRSVRAVMAIIVRNGVASEEIALTKAPSPQGVPQIARIGTRYLTAWSEPRSDGPIVRHALIDADGNRLTSVTDTPGHFVALCSNGISALLLVTRGESLDAIQVNGDATIVSEARIERPSIDFPESVENTAAVWAGTHYLAIWVARDPDMSGRARFMRSVINTNGTATPPEPLEIRSFEGGVMGRPDLAFDGNGALLVWSIGSRQWPDMPMIPPHTGTMALRLDAFGRALDAQPTRIAEASIRVDVASSGDGFVVVNTNFWRGKVEALAVNTDGAAIDVVRKRDLLETVGPYSSTVVWTGDDYAIGIAHAAIERYVVVQFVNGRLEPTKQSRSVTTDGTSAGVPEPALEPLPGGDVLVGWSQTVTADHFEAVTYRSHSMGHLPPLPEPPAAASWRPLLPTLSQVNWHFRPHDKADGFLITGVSDGIGAGTAVADRDARTATLIAGTSPRLQVFVQSFNAAGLSTPTLAQSIQPRRRPAR